MPSSNSSNFAPVIPNKLYTLKACRYRASRKIWKHVSNRREEMGTDQPSSVRIITWNVDFQNHYPNERMLSVLRHIEKDVLDCKEGDEPEPSCILLQEVHFRALKTILDDEWVRENYIVTPIARSKWPIGHTDGESSIYGNVTLVTRSLNVEGAQLLEFGLSTMQRTGLMVDITLSTPGPESRNVSIRIINTHLESLPVGAIARPLQLSLLAGFLKMEKIDGGLVAGDMNTILPEDSTITVDAGLRDAWRKGNKTEKGFTWGYQGGGNFPTARLDRVCYLPKKCYKVDEPQRIGVGLKTEAGGGQIWTSDHYGLQTTLRITP